MLDQACPDLEMLSMGTRSQPMSPRAKDGLSAQQQSGARPKHTLADQGHARARQQERAGRQPRLSSTRVSVGRQRSRTEASYDSAEADRADRYDSRGGNAGRVSPRQANGHAAGNNRGKREREYGQSACVCSQRTRR